MPHKKFIKKTKFIYFWPAHYSVQQLRIFSTRYVPDMNQRQFDDFFTNGTKKSAFHVLKFDIRKPCYRDTPDWLLRIVNFYILFFWDIFVSGGIGFWFWLLPDLPDDSFCEAGTAVTCGKGCVNWPQAAGKAAGGSAEI